MHMSAEREIEAIALENLQRQKDETERKMKEIEGKMEEPARVESVIGRFDGKSLEGEDGRIYPVPANYASKSCLVEGDLLRLYLGTMVFKQIGPVKRKPIFATYVGNAQVQDSTGMLWNVLRASVSFYELEDGCEVVCDVPEAPGASYAAIKGVIKRV